jgi:hypothetical protein
VGQAAQPTRGGRGVPSLVSRTGLMPAASTHTRTGASWPFRFPARAPKQGLAGRAATHQTPLRVDSERRTMRLSYRQSVAGGANTERIHVSSTDTVWLYGLFTARSGARVCFFETAWAYVQGTRVLCPWDKRYDKIRPCRMCMCK